MALRRAGCGYVLGINANSQFSSWIGKPEVAGTAEEIAQDLDPAVWRRLSVGDGTKGARLSDWAYLDPAIQAALDQAKRHALLEGAGGATMVIPRPNDPDSWALLDAAHV